MVFVEEIKDRPVDRLVSACRRKNITGCEVTEGGSGEQERTVGESGSKNGREIAIIDGKILCQAVVERDLVLGVEVHGLIFGGIFVATDVDLFGRVVYPYESIR